jgi:hypothetical protein
VKQSLLAVLFAFCAFLGTYTRSSADSGSCNEFESVQSVILSEATRQPFEAQLEIARVVVTKGVCYLDIHYYAGYGIAYRIYDAAVRGEVPYDACARNTHCRAYYLLSTIDPAIREPAALAAHVALTESPRIPRYHFDNRNSLAYWWGSPSACPHGWFITGDLKAC